MQAAKMMPEGTIAPWGWKNAKLITMDDTSKLKVLDVLKWDGVDHHVTYIDHDSKRVGIATYGSDVPGMARLHPTGATDAA